MPGAILSGPNTTKHETNTQMKLRTLIFDHQRAHLKNTATKLDTETVLWVLKHYSFTLGLVYDS